MEIIDLRSDTVTKPDAAMLNAMIHAEVGDDVFNEDPTVLALEKTVSSMFGKEAGLFVPSGTMSNQLAIKVLTQTGEEVIIDESGHIFNYEGTTASWLSNVQLRPILGKLGKLTPALIEAAIRPKNDWDPHTSVIEIENTANKGGGTAYTRQELLDIKAVADKHNLFINLDGARIWNASVATGISLSEYGSYFDTISVCLSKGMGAPVGSLIVSDKARIKKALKWRKIFGGGMRQAGILAAAGIYAVDNNFKLLEIDHRNAKQFASYLNRISLISCNLDNVETNIVVFNLDNRIDVKLFVKRCKENGVLLSAIGGQAIRVVFHLDVNIEDTNQALNIIESVIKSLKK